MFGQTASQLNPILAIIRSHLLTHPTKSDFSTMWLVDRIRTYDRTCQDTITSFKNIFKL